MWMSVLGSVLLQSFAWEELLQDRREVAMTRSSALLTMGILAGNVLQCV